MTANPTQTLDQARLSRLQIAALAVTVGLNALDGFDVLSISFASPGIVKEWGVDRAALGLVLSMELIGMALGSVFLGGVADRIGRRPTVLGCLVAMVIGMAGATFAHDILTLSAWRILTGLGIGGMLAATNALAAEFSNARWKSLTQSLMVIGYPLGAVIGGSIAAVMLREWGWRSVFYFGAAATTLFIPLVLAFLPESPAFLMERQPKQALEKLNRLLKRMGHEVLAALPEKAAAPVASAPGLGLFSPSLRATTLLITAAYCAHIAAFYFILKWIPKIVVDMGFAASQAAGVLVWANVGGAIGGACYGLLARWVGVRRLTIVVMVLSLVMLTVFGRGQTDLQGLSLVSAATGFFTNSGVVGLYLIFAQAFPTRLRASGTGFAIGIGRGGSVMAPIIAGFLFQAGLGLQWVAMAMGGFSLLAAILLALAPLKAEGGDVKPT